LASFTLTPIGTCRVNNPIRRARGNFPFVTNFERVYGYTHTAGEAVQQIRFLQNEKTFAPISIPAVFRPNCEKRMLAETHKPSDLYLVEISSAKRIVAGDDLIQINYLNRHLSEFFSDNERTRLYWQLARPTTGDELADFLRADSVYASLSREDRELLANIRMTISDFGDIKAEMEEIVDRLGRDKVVFVTHVNARMSDGSLIGSRDRLIANVKEIAGFLGVSCYDPTHEMEVCGQENALERAGFDLTHYSETFCDSLFAAWYSELFIPRIGSVEASAASVDIDIAVVQRCVEDIAGKLAQGHLVEAAQELFSDLRRYPHAMQLVQLRGFINASLGNFEQAVADVKLAEDTLGQTDQGNRVLMRAYSGLERWEDTLAVAEGMLGDEIEDAELFETAARAAAKLDRNLRAFELWKRALEFNPGYVDGWLHALVVLDKIGTVEDVSAFFTQALQEFPNSLTLAREGLRLSILHNATGMFVRSLCVALAEAPGWALDTLRSCKIQFLNAALMAVENFVLATDFDPALSCTLKELGSSCLLEATRLRLSGCVDAQLQAFGLARLALLIAPSTEASNFYSAIIRHWGKSVRLAYKAKDHAQVVALTKDASALLREDSDVVLLSARSLLALGKAKEACVMLIDALRISRNNSSFRLLCARSCLVIEDVTEAMRLFDEVAADDEAIDDEMRGKLAHVEICLTKRVLPQIRSLVTKGEYDDAWELCKLTDKYSAFNERIARERKLILKACREDLRKVSDEEFSPRERLTLALRLLDKDGSNAYALRCAAVDSMQIGEFDRALGFWQRLDGLGGAAASIKGQISRCTEMIRRLTK
jgi:tetratricopeptide (TPR) repeat protein